MITGTQEELVSIAAGKECGRCHQVPRIAWAGAITGESTHLLRCDCLLTGKPPLLVPAQSILNRRRNEVMGTELARRETALSQDEITKYLVPGCHAERGAAVHAVLRGARPQPVRA